jgi:hypothetical protein
VLAASIAPSPSSIWTRSAGGSSIA